MESQPASPRPVSRPNWQRWLLIAAIAFAVVFSAVQLAGAVRQVSRVFAHRQDAIAPWMTIGHVARLSHVAPDALETALGLPAGSSGRRPLGAIARHQGESFEAFQAKVQAAIVQLGGVVPPAPPSGAPPPAPPSPKP